MKVKTRLPALRVVSAQIRNAVGEDEKRSGHLTVSFSRLSEENDLLKGATRW
jgi:hypothetical protein